MCGRYYVDDETSREIEKIVRKLDQRLKIEHGQDIHPSESAVILTKECKEVAARQMQWGFPGFQGKGLLIKACFPIHICYSSTHHFRYGLWCMNQMVNGIFCFENDTVI